MSTEAPAKATPVAAPAAAKPAATPTTNPSQTRSPEQTHNQSRQDRIKAAVEASRKKTEAPATTETAVKPETTTPAKTADKTDAAKPAAVEPPTLFKQEKTAEAAPAAEPDPIDQWKLAPNASAEAVKNFDAIRTEAKARKQRESEALKKAADLEAQLTTYRNAAPADTATVETLKTQLKDAHDRLAVFDLKSHPDFLREFSAPIDSAIAEANELMSWNVKDGETLPDLKALLSKSPKDMNAEIIKLTKDMSTAEASVVLMAMRKAHGLNVKQGEALSKSGEIQTRLQQQSAQQSKAAFEEVSKNLGPSGEFLQPLEIVEGLSPEDKAEAESYNASLGSVRANAEKFAFGQVDAKGVATLSYKAATFDHMLSHTIPRVQAEFRKISQLCKEQADVIKQLRGGGSGANDLGSGGAGGGHEVDVSKMSIEQRVKYRLAEAKKAKQR